MLNRLAETVIFGEHFLPMVMGIVLMCVTLISRSPHNAW